ncbi:MAG: hypothetical protein VKJ05_05510 [Synechococcaceae cyanobacterium]|nr:hypothetical protein [Synechococcaceae cyanobacterium]
MAPASRSPSLPANTHTHTNNNAGAASAVSLGAAVAAGLFLLPLLAPAPGRAAGQECHFLEPVGGNGTTPIVSKRVGPGRLLGRTNWNTDFVVDRPYRSFRFFFTATSTDPKARYPVSGWMKFSDGSSLRLFEQILSPPVGRGRQFGPFAAVPGKQASQMNFRIGAANQPGSLGFSYRISVQGCL